MKIGLFSDTHLEHHENKSQHAIIQRIVDTSQGVDVLINAGDTHHNPSVRDFIRRSVAPTPYVEVLGNHDFYGLEFGPHLHQTLEVDGLRIFSATMWTHFDDDALAEWKAQRYISDFRWITGASVAKMKEQFWLVNRVVEETRPDIVVTHFAPGPGSIHPRYAGDALNPYFCPNQTSLILRARPKLWLHGHVHDPHDYVVGETRVIGNPFGYPGETYLDITDYSVRIIDVD